MTMTVWLKITDGYPVQVPTKLGEAVEWSPEVIFVTSNYTPEEVFSNGRRVDAALRRITHTIEVNEENFCVAYILINSMFT